MNIQEKVHELYQETKLLNQLKQETQIRCKK